MPELKTDNTYLWPHIEAGVYGQVTDDLLSVSESFEAEGQLLLDYLRLPGRGIGGSLVLRASQIYDPGEYSEPATRLAAATEVMNAAILIVDDVLDGSAFRKGQPTIHKSHELSGEPPAMARAQAMQLGMATVYIATRMAQTNMTEAELPAQQNLQRGSLFVTAGQMLETRLAHDTSLQDEQHILAVHAHKTGWYSFESPLRTGLALARADRQTTEQVAEIAQLLGLTFQLQDDVNGVMGDPEITGKPNTDDAELRLYTMLYHEAKQHVPADEFAPVAERYGSVDIRPEDHEAYRALVRKYGINTLLNTRAQECLVSAEAKIESLDYERINPQFIEYLQSIVSFLHTKMA